MRYLAEVVGQIPINDLVKSPVQETMDTFDRIIGAPPRPIGVLFRLQVGLKDRRPAQAGPMSAPPGPGCTVFPTVGTSRAVSSG